MVKIWGCHLWKQEFGTTIYFPEDLEDTHFHKKYFLNSYLNRLPPGHPKAKITEAASHVREMIQNQIHMEPDQDDLEDDSEDEEEEDEHAMDLDSDMVNFELK